MEVGPSHQGPEHPAGDGSHGGSEQGYTRLTANWGSWRLAEASEEDLDTYICASEQKA